MDEARENLIDNYINKRNFGQPKFSYNTSSIGDNPSCGDNIEVFLSIENNKIKEISFTGEGCSIAIGTASILFEQVKGKNIDEVLNFDHDYPEKLIQIPLTLLRKKCALLSLESLQKAINKYVKESD